MTTHAAAGAGVLALTLALTGGPTEAHGDRVKTPTLTGFASLPALTFVPGSEPSGAALGTAPVNGIAAPWDDQPVQGFSGVLRNADGSFDVLSDNGFGTQANSADFLLRIQRIAPVFGTGRVDVLGGINLTDPNRQVPWDLVRDDRVLTGQDFDVESIVRDADGGYWIGEEFGPYLLHVDRAGRLLAPPVALPGVVSPETAARTGTTANLASSKGFEGLAKSPDGRYLYALLEGTVAGDTAGDLRFNEFATRTGTYTGKRFTYRLDAANLAIGDAIAVDENRFLVIERDGGQGATAVIKKIYLADKRDRNRDGVLDKTLVVDLMNIANPRRVGGFGTTFTFPFTTIEDVIILDDNTLGVLNDNNFPGSAGRTPGVADNNEFITVRLPTSLDADKRILQQR
ncbi:esterase-like activity of phytase family protein [Catenuloplanes japonicus]|uniref:esterase-like activity of phytase family protein n=1 Tax=Catenuloplanes japonicus TaxID=33876 RepID=UPI0005260E9C|nr:esterase-like activity of phytase family protein [Catenuloplanes japonicus]